MAVRVSVHFKLSRNFMYKLGFSIFIEHLSLIAFILGLHTLMRVRQMHECKVLKHM